jgi:XTP/dITP diphosphohydrolase
VSDPAYLARVTPRLLVATTSRDKIREIQQVLSDIPYAIITLQSWPHVAPPPELAPTFLQNARDKAQYYAEATSELTVAEDSGLEIDALEGAPGVESARFGGAAASYAQKFALIYDALRAKGAIESPARFVCAIALVRGRKVLFETEGKVEGRIVPEPRGTNGFGYDPIFFYPPYERTLAEVTAAQKGAVSHRGQAFRALRQFLLESVESVSDPCV